MNRGTTVEHWRRLQAFTPPRTPSRIGLIGGASFVGGLSESAVLILVALTADSLIRDVGEVTVAGVELARTDAALIALGFVALRIAMTLVFAATSSRFASLTMERAQASLYHSYLHSSYAARSARPPGDLATVSSNHCRFTGELANAFAIIATNACGLLAFGSMSLVVNPVATLGIAAIGAVLLALMRPLRARSRRAANAFSEGSRVVGHQLSEVENLNREIEVFQVQDPVEERLRADAAGVAGGFRHLRFLTEAIPQLFQALLLGAAVLSLLLIVNLPSVTDLAAVGAVVLLLIRSMSSAQGIVSANQKVIEYGAYTSGLELLVRTLGEQERTYGEARPDTLTPVRLDDVGFSYDSGGEVLSDIDLTLRRGELVGVVGPSGAGKTTLVELLLRLRAPTRGAIRCAATPIGEVDPDEFAARVAFVPQRPALIAGTVAENVDLFRGLPEERIREAVRLAHLADEVEALPEGIDTRLGPDDRSLSGGQAQRLTIARALAGDPEIIVLDEPTSALDTFSEHRVRQALAELPEGRLVVLVAHRYTTLRSCSRIIVLRDGRIEVDATPDRVSEESDFFRSMVGDAS